MTRSLCALVLVLALLPAGCGNGEAPGTVEPPETGETGAAAETVLGVYFLRDGSLAPAARRVPETRAVARAALEELLAGPTPLERGFGLETAVSAETELVDVAVEGGLATVELAAAPDRAAAGQIVFTLTQFPTVERVRIEPGGEELARADFEALLRPILVESPALGARVTSPVTVRGSAMVFEATVLVTLTDGDGRILAEEVATATEGAPARGEFSVDVPFDVEEEQLGAVIAAAPNAAGGPPQHAFEAPVRLLP